MKVAKKKPSPAEGKIIFVLLPHTVQYTIPIDPDEDEGSMFKGGDMKSKRLPAGMLAAQTGHVVSLMRTDPRILKAFGRVPITTLTFSVRNSRELAKLRAELNRVVLTWEFRDTNHGFYGIPDEIPTAVCTMPVEREIVDHVIGHLELYKEIHQW